MENRKCNKHFCEEWGEWVTTNPCFSPMGCGTGVEAQQRPCNGGLPGSPGCQGEDSREVRCQLEPCPAQWGQWMQWTSCSKSCGENIQKQRRRLCEDRSNPSLCLGSDTEYAMCNLPQCQFWSEWQDQGSCSKTCGGGSLYQVRECVTFAATQVCAGSKTQSVRCNTMSCPRWNNWGQWDSCVNREKSRERTCSNGIAGQDCLGEDTETTICFASTGIFGSSSREEATRGFGGSNPFTSFGGNNNFRSTTGWTQWGSWSGCFNNFRERTRQCLSSQCFGSANERNSCSTSTSSGWWNSGSSSGSTWTPQFTFNPFGR